MERNLDIESVRKYQEEHRCKHPNHPTTHTQRDGTCPKAWKCNDKYANGCIAK